jgi:hypothetical protein
VDQEVEKTLGELELKLQELERELTSLGRRDEPAGSPKASGRLIDEAVEDQRESGSDAERRTAERRVAEETAAEGDGLGGPAVFGGEEVPAQAGATVERDWTAEVRETAYGEIPTPPPPLPSPPPPPPSPTPQPPPSTPPGPPVPTTPPGMHPPSTPPGMHPSTSAPGMHPSTTPPGTPPPASPPGMHPPSTPLRWTHPPDPRRSAAVEENESVDLVELVRFRDKLASTMGELIDEYSRLLCVEPPSRQRPDA